MEAISTHIQRLCDRMFGRNKKKSKEDEVNELNSVKVTEKPQICLIDVEDGVVTHLKKCGFNINIGTLGRKITVKNLERYKAHHCLPNFYFPQNLHEHEIVIIDLKSDLISEYSPEEHERAHAEGENTFYFQSSYPERLFDPRPFGAFTLDNYVRDILFRGGIIIVFTDELKEKNYTIVRITSHGPEVNSEVKYSNYSFYSTPPLNTKHGERVEVLESASILKPLLEKHILGMKYDICFQHPSHWDGRERVLDTDFDPLLINSSDEIVGFLKRTSTGAVLFVPQIQDKAGFLQELMMDYLPSMYPQLFPFNTEFQWLEEEGCLLPHEAELVQRRDTLVQEHERKIADLNNQIEENRKKYSCLHDLLIQSGDELVESVKKFLEWLGFEDVTIMDVLSTERLDEDLQVVLPNGLLLVEVKGIGGTSKDGECSQIDKVVLRRMRERNKTDVRGLYIVNHQRHQPPRVRENPPFTKEQIADAEDNKRGMVTTWQLYNLYFSTKNGAISKEEARESLLLAGLVDFKPSNCIDLGKPKDVLQKGSIILLDVTSRITTDDSLILERAGRYYRAKIENMQINGRDVTEVDSGGVGIKVDIPAKKSDHILLKKA